MHVRSAENRSRMERRLSRRALVAAAAGCVLPLVNARQTAAPAGLAVTPAAVPSPIERGAVAFGAFVPGAPADPATLDRFARRVGRMPAAVSWYEAWGGPDAITGPRPRTALLETVAARGAVPMITWEPWVPGAGVEQPAYRPALVARGDFDAYLRSWADDLAAWKRPVFVRMFHEMNADWYPWGAGVNGNTPRDLVDAWRHAREVFAAARADNVLWVWCPDAGRGEVGLDALYPGDPWVDWVGLDGYNWGANRPESGWRSFDEVFSDAYAELTALTDRPLMIAETASSEKGGDKAAWIADAFAALPTRFPRVRLLGWFDEARPDGDWPVDTSPASLAAFKAAVAAPGMQGRVP
jgi:hypothetical protein